MRVALAMMAASALAGRNVCAQEEATGPYRTAISVTGGLSVGSTGSHFGLFDIPVDDDDAGFAVGGSIAHDLTPRLTLEASGAYQDRGASAWSADAGVRLNLKPSSESVVPYFAVSGGLYGQSKTVPHFPRDPLRALDLLRGGTRFPPRLGDFRSLLDSSFSTTTVHSTDGMVTLGSGVMLAAGPHVFVRPDARLQVVFSDDTNVLGLFTLNFGYRF